MIITVKNESPFQILSSSFSIGPSETGYDLQVGADSRNFTTLFSVGANTPRMVTNVANGSYFRLKNNVGDVKVNWQRVCTDEGGGSVDLSAYWTSAQTQSAITAVEDHLFDVEQVTASALTELHDGLLEVSARTVDMSAYWTSAETQDAIDEAISGFTPSANSPIIPAITTQAEYEAISGNVKTGDLIQVQGVVLDGYVGPQYGLFEATVEEEESDGVVRKIIYWFRKDNAYSVTWSEDYPWMADNGIQPIDLGPNGFIISTDFTAEEEEFNGIGFDEDGKPVITHFSPEYDEETGEVTGITREDTPIGGGADMSAYYTSAQTENAISAATSGKADAANVTARGNQFRFPYWNAQGVITGETGQLYAQLINVNGASLTVISSAGSGKAFFAPTAAGTAGDILVSTGNGAPVWTADNKVSSTSVSTIWKGTQAEYDAIATKDPNTFYIIVSN